MADYTYDSSIHGYFTSAAVQQSINRNWHQNGNLAAVNGGGRIQSDYQLQDQSREAIPYSDPAYSDVYEEGRSISSRPSRTTELNCEPPTELSELTHHNKWTTHSLKGPIEKQWEDKLSQNLQLYKEKHPVVSSHHTSTTAPPCVHSLPSHSFQPPSSLPSVTKSQFTSQTQTVVSAQQSYWQQCSVAPNKSLTTVNAVTHNEGKLNEGQSKSNEQEFPLPFHSHQANVVNRRPSLSVIESEKRNFVHPSNPNNSDNQHEQEFNRNSDGFGLGESQFLQSDQNLCVEDQPKPPRIPQLDFPLEFWTKEMWFWHDEKHRLNNSLRRRHKKKGYWSDKIHERAKEASRCFKRLYRQLGEDLSTRTDLNLEDMKKRKLESIKSKGKMIKLLHPPPEVVPSASDETQPPSRRHWQKETKLTECAKQQAVARVMEKVFSNAEPFSRFHGLKDVVKKATAKDEKRVEKLDKYNREISCRNIDNDKSFSQNLHPRDSFELLDDSHLARSPVALQGYPHFGSNLLPKSLNSDRNVPSHRPKQPARHPPNMLNWPPNIPNRPPNWRNHPPNMPFGPPNMPFGPPNLPFNPPNMPFGPSNRPFDPPNMHFGPLNMPFGSPNLRYSPPNVFERPSSSLDRDPELRRSPVPIQEETVQKSHVVDVGLPCLYSMVDRVEENITVPVEKHMFSGCLCQPHNSKGGPFMRDSFIVPPQGNFLPLRDGPIVDRRDVGRGALAVPSKLVCYSEGELGSSATHGVFSGKFLKANYFKTPLYDPFTNSGLSENLKQPVECAVDSPQQTESDAMEILCEADHITNCSFGKNELSKSKHYLSLADESLYATHKRSSSAPDDLELQKLLMRVQGNLQNLKEDNHHQREPMETCGAPQDAKNCDLSKRVTTLAERKHAHRNDKDASEIDRTFNKRCVEDLAKNVIKKLYERKNESNLQKDDVSRKSIPVNVEKGEDRLSPVVTRSRVVEPHQENVRLKKLNKSNSFHKEQSAKKHTHVHPMRVHFEGRPALENKVMLDKNSDRFSARSTNNILSLFHETESVPANHRVKTSVIPAHSVTNVANSYCPNLGELLRRIEVNLDKKLKSHMEQEKDHDLIMSGVRQSRLTAEVTGFDGRQREERRRLDGEIARIPERLRGRLGGKVDRW